MLYTVCVVCVLRVCTSTYVRACVCSVYWYLYVLVRVSILVRARVCVLVNVCISVCVCVLVCVCVCVCYNRSMAFINGFFLIAGCRIEPLAPSNNLNSLVTKVTFMHSISSPST